jgi:hypothetical protein
MTINPNIINKIQAFLDENLVIKTSTNNLKDQLRNQDILTRTTYQEIADPEKEKIKEFIKKHRLKGFRDLLFKYIDDQDKKDAEIYKKALLDRRLFSKIRSDDAYQPNKKTVLALIFALKLDLNQALALLKAAGFTLSLSSVFDLIMVYCINNRIDDILEVNEILLTFNFKPLGQFD